MTFVQIADIKVGARYRRDMGDMEPLVQSVRELGMLQPIGLTVARELIFGGRRLEAARRLGWVAVPAVVLDSLGGAAAMLKAERDENRCRKEMTPSELVELGRALEAVERAEGEKRRAANLKQNKDATESRPGGFREGKTDDKVGEALGVSGDTYARAKKVVEQGTPELVAAMDAGELSVKQAAKVAELAPEAQARVVGAEEPREAAKEEVGKAEARKKARKKKAAQDEAPADVSAPEPPADPAAAFVSRVNKLCSAIDAAKAEVKELAADTFGRHIHAESVTQQLAAARSALWQARPTAPCNCVKGGTAARPECKACFGLGITTEARVLKGGR